METSVIKRVALLSSVNHHRVEAHAYHRVNRALIPIAEERPALSGGLASLPEAGESMHLLFLKTEKRIWL
jgi:hypothetical protein